MLDDGCFVDFFLRAFVGLDWAAEKNFRRQNFFVVVKKSVQLHAATNFDVDVDHTFENTLTLTKSVRYYQEYIN